MFVVRPICLPVVRIRNANTLVCQTMNTLKKNNDGNKKIIRAVIAGRSVKQNVRVLARDDYDNFVRFTSNTPETLFASYRPSHMNIVHVTRCASATTTRPILEKS